MTINVNEIKEYVEEWLKENEKEFYNLSDYMWENPELGLEEFGAFTAINKILKEHNYKVESGVGGMPTAFIATYGTEGPVIGINVEYDCLPGLSQEKDKPFPSPIIEGAPGQGCGHNILGPTALKVGIALRYVIEKYDLKAVIKLFGSPYEEASVGKPLVGRAGGYEGVDCFLDWHPWHFNRANYEKCNSVFVVNFEFAGKMSHGAYPWIGRSAFDAAMLFGHSLEMLREHIIPSGPDAAHTINYTFTDVGAEFANVVPDRTVVQLYGRFNTLEVSEDAFNRIIDAAEGCAKATGTTVEPKVMTYTHNQIPNKTLSQVVYNNLQHYGAPEFTEDEHNFVKEMQRYSELDPTGIRTDIDPFGPSESIIKDTSEFSWNAPYAPLWMAMGPTSGWHNWMVTACAGNSIGRKTMDKAAQIMTSSAIDLIINPKIIDEAKVEWKERMGSNTYKSLLPEGHTAPLGVNAATMDKYFPNRKRHI